LRQSAITQNLAATAGLAEARRTIFTNAAKTESSEMKSSALCPFRGIKGLHYLSARERTHAGPLAASNPCCFASSHALQSPPSPATALACNRGHDDHGGARHPARGNCKRTAWDNLKRSGPRRNGAEREVATERTYACDRDAAIGKLEGLAMRTTILAYVIAFAGLAMIATGVWGIFLLIDAEPMVEVVLSDYAIAIEMIGGGLGMIGLAQALRLLLEINGAKNHPAVS
jgi:hypothetical protein